MISLASILGGALLLTLALGGLITFLGVHHGTRRWPPAGSFLEVRGQRLHYTDQGEGPAIVLIHGASSNLLEFQCSLVPALVARGHRVLAFDRPGHGHSPRPAGHTWMDPAELAALLMDACDQLGVRRPLLLGHSLAGSMVMAGLVHEGARIRGAVLLAGAAGHWVTAPSLEDRLRLVPGLLPLFAHTLVYPIGRFLIPKALRAVFAPHEVPPSHAERIGATLALQPASFLQNAQDIRATSPYLQQASVRYREIIGPLLVIHGTDDDIVPYWNHGQRLEGIVGPLQVELLPGQGHALHHVERERVANLVSTFSASLDEKST